ncbi:MAG: WecB/TagA/CpsF family glycosyltransferase, partial [Candidatus Neomarinimicrobiota bacterium]
ILGINICATNIPEILKSIYTFIRSDEKHYVIIRDIHGLIQAHNSEPVMKAHTRASLVVPDGMPLVWIGKLKGFKEIDRCYGPDLMLAVMKESVKNGYRHFFYGGKPGVAEDLESIMEIKFPSVNVVGIYTPPFRPLNQAEEIELIALVSKVKPDIFWVGISTPKQEIFMHDYLSKLETKVMIGVGAAFDLHTRRIKQAPVWIQRSGFEWLFRIFQEPTRLWKRYLFVIPAFIFLYIQEIFKIKHSDTQ